MADEIIFGNNEDSYDVLKGYRCGSGSSLPAVTSADDGKVLTVINGNWGAKIPYPYILYIPGDYADGSVLDEASMDIVSYGYDNDIPFMLKIIDLGLNLDNYFMLSITGTYIGGNLADVDIQIEDNGTIHITTLPE